MTFPQFLVAGKGTIGMVSKLLVKSLRHMRTKTPGRGGALDTVEAPALHMDSRGG